MISERCAMRSLLNPIHFNFSAERWVFRSHLLVTRRIIIKKNANFTLENESSPSSKACTHRSYAFTCRELIPGHAYSVLGNRAFPLRL